MKNLNEKDPMSINSIRGRIYRKYLDAAHATYYVAGEGEEAINAQKKYQAATAEFMELLKKTLTVTEKDPTALDSIRGQMITKYYAIAPDSEWDGFKELIHQTI